MSDRPYVGIGVFVLKNGKFLVGHRKGSHSSDTWALPGGHLEFGESFEETAKREMMEETGLAIKNVRFGAVTNDLFEKDNRHYVTIWIISDWASGEPEIMEPEKCQELRWVDLNTIPKPWFPGWKTLFESEFIEPIRQKLK